MCCVYLCLLGIFFFFFKQKTAYEMRISDWSSDVCSSDLVKSGSALLRLALSYVMGLSLRSTAAWAELGAVARLSDVALLNRLRKAADWLGVIVDPEARRVGKECVRTCRSRW